MTDAAHERINFGEIEELQTDVLRQLDDLNKRIERTLAEVTATRLPGDTSPELL